MRTLTLLKKEEEFSKIQERFISLTDEKTFTKELSFAAQILEKNKYLNDKASTSSKLAAVLNVAQLGLTLNPVSKLAYLIPRTINGQVECVLEPSYQGLVKLATDTGSVKQIYAHVVYEGDEFQEVLGTEVSIIHIPKRKSTNFELVYAVAVLNDGSKMVEVMTLKDVNDIRATSESYKSYERAQKKGGYVPSCVWVDHFEEMARKTVIKRLVKYVPKTESFEKLAQAISLTDSDYGISDSQADYIESLLINAAIDDDRKAYIERNLLTMSGSDAGKLIAELQQNQLDPIAAGNNYNAGDIQNKLRTENQ